MDGKNAPLWYASTVTAVGLAYVIVRFLVWVYRQYREERRRRHQEESEHKRMKDEDSTRRRREAEQEAWQVVDRLKQNNDKLEAKIDILEKRCDEAIEKCEQEKLTCERELAYIKGRMQVIEAWAVAKGLRLPKGADGSGTHRPIQGDDT